MTTFQKVIKYLAIALAVFLIVMIFSGIFNVLRILFDNTSSEDAVAKEMTKYPIASDIHDLDIQINAADLSIKTGDSFLVESNLKHLKMEEKDGVLILEDTKKHFGTYDGALLTIYVPDGMVFDHITLLTGAGKLTVENLSAKTIDLTFGVGDASIDTLIATKSIEMEGGAGRITVAGGALQDLDLDMGVGQLNLTSALGGNCNLNLGIGESNITLIGSREDYRLELEKGIGSISVDGKTASDYGSSGNGTNQVKITGGIGAIKVTFKEDNTK